MRLRQDCERYEQLFLRKDYVAWVARGCPVDNPNPPDIWLAELAMTAAVPEHLLDLDRMQVILERLNRE